MTEVPEIPDYPEIPGVPGVPDFPDFPDFPEIPEGLFAKLIKIFCVLAKNSMLFNNFAVIEHFFNTKAFMIMKKIALLLLTVLTVATAFAQEKYDIQRDIAYTDGKGMSEYRADRCKLDVYYPTDRQGFKTLVWFHGGGLEGGNKEIPNELRRAGFAIVAPSYSLFPKGKCPEYIEDAAAAVAWTFKNIEKFGGDPTQIYVAGHSAGGYLTLMLALDKSYLARHGVDADAVKAYYPVSGQTATHYTIRKERGIDQRLPIVDEFAPLNKARILNTELVLITGERKLEMMARYEENLYLKSILEGVGNKEITIHEMSGFDHGSVLVPACDLIKRYIKR